jgi:hypothetical protein
MTRKWRTNVVDRVRKSWVGRRHWKRPGRAVGTGGWRAERPIPLLMEDHDSVSGLRQRDRTILALSAFFVVGLALLFHLTPEPSHLVMEHHFTLRATWLYEEHGIYESASVVFLLGAVVVARAGLRQVHSGQSRVTLVWLAGLALLAAMRELDMHILLNPEYLSSMGVRYRIDWWLDGDVSLGLKAFWATVFASLGLMVLLPLVLYRRQTIRCLRDLRDPSVQMLALTGILMAVGFTMDDLLRGATFLSDPIKDTIEEGAEALGALCFLLATIGYATVPISARLRSAEGA